MDLYGKALAPRQLRQRVGRLAQVAGIEPFVFDEGPACGVRALRFKTGGGLSLDILCDRGMDLGAAEYRGAPLAWLSPTGVVAPHLRELGGEGWLRSFGGGLLVTCGLQNVGEPSVRNSEKLRRDRRAIVSIDAITEPQLARKQRVYGECWPRPLGASSCHRPSTRKAPVGSSPIFDRGGWSAQSRSLRSRDSHPRPAAPALFSDPRPVPKGVTREKMDSSRAQS